MLEYTSDNYLICLGVSFILGLGIAFAMSYKTKQSKSFFLTLLVLPAVVQTIIMLVNGNLGTGIAVMGAFSLVRFRSAAGSAKEIIGIFLSTAVGLATAMGYIVLAPIFTVIVCLVIIVAEKLKPHSKDDLHRTLRVTVPEDLNYEDNLKDILEKYTKQYNLDIVKTSNMGSLYKLTYDIVLKDKLRTKDFIDEIRIRNGNLEVAIMLPEERKENYL